jgi:hypothetical protein
MKFAPRRTFIWKGRELLLTRPRPLGSNPRGQLSGSNRCRVMPYPARGLSHIPKYRSASPTHNGIWQCDGPRLVLLGEPTAPPSPDRDVAAVCGLTVRHPIPRHPAPYGLPPKRKLRNPGREQRSGFFRLSISPAEPCPRLTRVLTLILGPGNGCRAKTSFGSISSSREPSRYFAAMEGSRFVRRWGSRALNRLLQT